MLHECVLRLCVPSHLKLKYRNLIRLTAEQRSDPRLVAAREALKMERVAPAGTTVVGGLVYNPSLGASVASLHYQENRIRIRSLKCNFYSKCD